MSNMDRRVLNLLKDLHHGVKRYGEKSDCLREFCIEKGFDPRDGDLVTHNPIPVPILAYPWRTMPTTLLGRWITAIIQSLAIYAPVHLIPLILFKPKKLIESPWEMLIRLIKASTRSALFLGTFVGLVWAGVVFGRLVTGTDSSLGPGSGSLICGLSILLEKKSRRPELTMYVLPRAIHATWLRLTATYKLKTMTHGEVLIFAMAGAIAMYFYEANPTTIRSSIRSLMQSYFGRV